MNGNIKYLSNNLLSLGLSTTDIVNGKDRNLENAFVTTPYLNAYMTYIDSIVSLTINELKEYKGVQ